MSNLQKLHTLFSFYRAEPTPEDIFLYESALKELTEDQLAQACATAIKRCRYMPKPVELIEFVEALAPSKALPPKPDSCPTCGGEYGHGEHDPGDPMPDSAREALKGLYGKFGVPMPEFKP